MLRSRFECGVLNDPAAGLIGAVHLNGQEGAILGSVEQGAGRVVVRLDNGTEVKVKRENYRYLSLSH